MLLDHPEQFLFLGVERVSAPALHVARIPPDDADGDAVTPPLLLAQSVPLSLQLGEPGSELPDSPLLLRCFQLCPLAVNKFFGRHWRH